MTSKGNNIMLRVDAETKQRINDAARRTGKSITAFMLDATMRDVERVEKSAPKAVERGACPTYFKALCRTAAAGGRDGYATAGYELVRHVHDLSPFDMDDDEWKGRIEALEAQLEGELRGACAEDDALLIAWFETNLPRCMALVPPRRRDTFLAGVRRYCEDHW